MLTAARNASHRQHRRRAGQPAATEALDALGAAAGWGADPERAVIAAEEEGRLRRALEDLDVEDREVIVLRDLEGLSGPEAAQILGLELAALKSRLHRARLRLLARLGGGDG